MILRSITGALLGIAAIVVVVYGGYVYLAVAIGLAVIGLNEYFRFVDRYRPLRLAGFIAVVAMAVAAWFLGTNGLLAAVAGGTFIVCVAGMALGPKPGVVVRIGMTLLGVLGLGLGFAHLVLLRNLDVGRDLVLTVIFGTWTNDTMAYFVGRFFGAHPMAPNLSPKKTWEGFAGGAIFAALIVLLIGLYTPLVPLQSLALAAVIVVFGPGGDLFESLIKRDMEIKDSGRAIPGHGGVLDRFDALLWTTVAAYYLLTVVFHY